MDHFTASSLTRIPIFLPLPLAAPVVTVITRPSSPQCRCRNHHAHGYLTRSRWCRSPPPPRETTDAEGGVSLWPLTSRSARSTATALNMDTLSESPSESICPCLCGKKCVNNRANEGERENSEGTVAALKEISKWRTHNEG